MSSPSNALVHRVKRVLFGQPKRTDQQHHERLGLFTGLAVFSADALSSVAYATEEILLILAVAGGAAAGVFSLAVGLAIVALVFIVAASYNQTIHAYPSGGGSYVVSKENLGMRAGLTAGAALLVDYVLTVAVSTASGIAAVTSALPVLQGHEVALCLLAVWIVAWVNLRGVKESGAVFAVPTYGFVVAIFLMIGVGGYKALTGHWDPVAPIAAGFGLGSSQFKSLTSDVTMFMLLRAFASGCTALSGIEAVSNGVMAFKRPEPDNAIKTMNLERTILYVMFVGVTLLAYGFRLMPSEGETLLSQIAHVTFGTGPLYYLVQATTALILLLAANTAYADFPRLTGMIARDGYLPRKLANLGDTLVFHYGILVLALLASSLIVIFRGDVHLLIPLYAVGVFLAFTMSQTGMVVHWLKIAKQPGESLKRHAWSVFINGLGAVLSGVALVVIAMTKFIHGAWIVCIIIPLLVSYFLHVHGYYKRFTTRVASLLEQPMPIDSAKKVKVVLTIGGLSPVIDHAMRVARRLSDDITAVYVAIEPELGEKFERKWDLNRHGGVPLAILPSPYRDVVAPLRKYLDKLQHEHPDTLINLLVPVIVTNEPFDEYLHNGAADMILRELRYSQGIIVTEIPFYVNMHTSDPGVLCYEVGKAGDD
jgi:amino acid transporter